MPKLMPRSAWTTHARPVTKLVQLAGPRGFAVHWPGTTTDHIDAADPARIARMLEAERADHVNGRGWSDIAYQAGVDQAGRVWDLRGLEWRSAANGDQTVNASHGAITLLLGDQDTPSPAMVDAVQWWRTTMWLPRYPHGTAVVGHRDLHSTDCPGPAAYQLVRDGTFTHAWTPGTPQEADVQLTDVVGLGAGTRAILKQLTGQDVTQMQVGDLLQRVLGNVLTVANQAPPVATVDVAALAAALAPRLPAGVDPHAVAVEVAADLAARLAS